MLGRAFAVREENQSGTAIFYHFTFTNAQPLPRVASYIRHALHIPNHAQFQHAWTPRNCTFQHMLCSGTLHRYPTSLSNNLAC